MKGSVSPLGCMALGAGTVLSIGSFGLLGPAAYSGVAYGVHKGWYKECWNS
nr:hypothetical protein [uncultured Chryseobacterium sp.]